jgi:two-component system, response regulator YesN
MERRTVLLVEDDALIRDVIKGALERQYRILEASRYSEVGELLGKPFDIAIIDYMLPDKDGLGVVKMVRERYPLVPIIMMTAYSSEDVAIKALRAGVTDYIKKPLVLTCLLKKIPVLVTGEKEEALVEEVNSKEEFLIEGIAAFMESNYFEDITRDQLAKKLCMNMHKFSKLFNKRFGCGMKSYLNSIRAKKAAELLKNNRSLSIDDIAAAVGYKSIVHFDRVFKEIYGIAPKDYRTDTDGASHLK